MTPARLRTALRFGVLALLVLAPLPYGSVQPGAVLAVELTAAVLGIGAVLLIARDREAAATAPKVPLAICLGIIALGVFQILPIPFSLAERFNPTADLVRPLIPYISREHSPQVTWSVASVESTDALLRFIAYVLIGLATAVAFDEERARRRFALVLLGVAVFQAIYGSGEYLTGRQQIFGFAKKHYLDSATGTFINRNHFATLLAIALPFALVDALPERARRVGETQSWRQRVVAMMAGGALRQVLGVGASALIWMGLLFSHSRAGLVAAVAAAAVVLVRFRGVRAARWAAAIGPIVLLLMLSTEFAQAPGERFFSVRHDIEAEGGRVTVWRDTAGLVLARPVLGWGFGTFESVFPIVQSATVAFHYDHAHNDWIEWASEGGIPTLAAAVALFVLALRRGGTASRAALVAVALHALWDFSLRIPAVAIATAAAMGLGYSAHAAATALRESMTPFPQGSPPGATRSDSG